MRVCGLDVAKKTGWCIATGNTYQTGVFDAGKVGKRSIKDEAERNANFRKWLWAHLKSNDIQAVAIEAPIKGNMEKVVTDDDGKPVKDKDGNVIKKSVSNYEAKAVAAYMIGCAKEVCFSLNIPFYMVAVQTWRSQFNKGVPRKQKTIKEKGKEKIVDETDKEVTRRACEMMKIEVRTLDASDAAGIAYWLQTFLKINRGQMPLDGLFADQEVA
ncbi:hypothetical protein [Roseibium album]|uniref:hypothetical protein n=1 Tax=Roseibium album TaxID=311410 RepID=UPI0039196857